MVVIFKGMASRPVFRPHATPRMTNMAIVVSYIAKILHNDVGNGPARSITVYFLGRAPAWAQIFLRLALPRSLV